MADDLKLVSTLQGLSGEELIILVGFKSMPIDVLNLDEWFVKLESEFMLRKIETDILQYFLTIAQFDYSAQNIVPDIISNTPVTDKYLTLKEAITTRTAMMQLQKYINNLNFELIKPSKWLETVVKLGNKIPKDWILKLLWMKTLPPELQKGLFAESQSAFKIGVKADLIYDSWDSEDSIIMDESEIYGSVSAETGSELESDESELDESDNTGIDTVLSEDTNVEMVDETSAVVSADIKIEETSAVVSTNIKMVETSAVVSADIKIEESKISVVEPKPVDLGKKVPEKVLTAEQQISTFMNSKYCDYHEKYGGIAVKCIPPCKYKPNYCDHHKKFGRKAVQCTAPCNYRPILMRPYRPVCRYHTSFGYRAIHCRAPCAYKHLGRHSITLD